MADELLVVPEELVIQLGRQIEVGEITKSEALAILDAHAEPRRWAP
jgi:hypothetical protein